jgi:hypothetical protein
MFGVWPGREIMSLGSVLVLLRLLLLLLLLLLLRLPPLPLLPATVTVSKICQACPLFEVQLLGLGDEINMQTCVSFVACMNHPMQSLSK